ncbi:DUF1294 domain-containing protein [Microbacterium hominis]|uniref:DUF1294 domain-containing protein n=1 Tax=Microbacterium hominis TaxID=162426 RepID=A0A7D4Q560_9MICO|nr:DUF1294 domain-containing protein [Microbacterium hominis]
MSRPLPAALSWSVLGGFVAGFAIAFEMFDLPMWMPLLYAGVSLVAFAAYGIDKSAARREHRRVSESTLLTLGLLCGWPGAVVAQQLFRHKTRKRSFRRAFWRTVVWNVMLLVVVVVAAQRGVFTLPELPLFA